ncbi:MAG: PD40 domain-containing protein [Sandaracinaceae bacterium]|nr:PD40 domain-containing protein [Sandaracinaceae bacterium]
MQHLPRSAVSLLVFLLAACDPGGPLPTSPCGSDAECDTGEMCVDGACRPATPRMDGGGTPPGVDSGGPGVTVASVRLEPASAGLVAVDGSRPTQTFMAIAVLSDGTEAAAIAPTFSLDSVSIGDIDPASGVFTANGFIGGSATVTVSVPNGGAPLSATATVSVRLERTVRGDGVTDEDVMRFGTATPVDDSARNAAVVYPLDGVVMPQNVYPADVQWTRSADGDLFRVSIVKASVVVTAYLRHDPMMHWLIDETAWRAMAQSEPEAAATLTVDRLEAATGELVRGTPLTMSFAQAALAGSVYYWDIVRGRIVRIDDGTATRVEFMPNPPPGPTDGSRCVGCHSVSHSGRYMAGRLGGGDNQGAIFDLTTDLTPDPPATTWPVNNGTLRWWFSSWSPDDSRLVVAYRGGAPVLGFVDTSTGAEVLPASGSMPSGTYPAWSPDGASIAYTGDQNGWGDGPTVGNIYVLPVTGPDSVGAPTRVHEAASIAGSTVDSYPTWAPDSSLIAFANGTGARSETAGRPVNLYAMAPDGSNVVALTRAASTTMDYQPRFSPFQQGGYFWMSFLSRRIYGNPAIGNSTSAEGRRQQIWVAGIRMGAAPGEDPSAVAYWLPGQDPHSANISAYWAPRPCRPDGESCSVGSECCGGDCRPPAGGGDPVCSPPPPDRCRGLGETCGSDADCCPDMGLTCVANVCLAGPG